jgi:hypothetical protein
METIMKLLKKFTAGTIIIAAAATLATPASAEWRRVGPYGGNDLYPSLAGCTMGGWVCEQARIKKNSGNVSQNETNSGERKAGGVTGRGAEKVYCTDGDGHYKSANKGCGGKWHHVEMGNK